MIKGEKLHLWFVDYQNALNRVKHEKLAEVMEKAGVPDLERRLIINLYWRQYASVKWDGEISKEVRVERGVRQGCVISPLLFNLYSEFMIKEAMENVEGIKFNGINITDLRYADDAVLVADKRKKMQIMIDRLSRACKEYGMEINVKNTIVMVVSRMEEMTGMQRSIMLDGVPLEQVKHFKYLGSWITDDAKSDEDIKQEWEWLKRPFSKIKN